ncbi:glycoside hydrolase 43 family protein [Actinophytocola sp.]|uniref:glycoside hydrolase family 43 protein n=1 Tax=Actinophytocola sp. TaxID=1872138 RepID=UPI002ED5082C
MRNSLREASSMDFTNPVLNADWPDPDVVRVGDDYFMAVSSFNRAPGLPVLHSRDLVTWEVIARALPAVPPEAHYRLPRHGGGVWAPSIRHHDGTFHITYPDPDHGIFVVSAEDPRGPWSPARLLLGGTGLIDPCPLWDDGRAYLVHGWARSRSGVANRLTMVEVDNGLTRLVGVPRTVIDGAELPGYHTLEGPKLYKRDGWYWIFAPAGGVATGWQSAFRARDIAGPYEGRVVLAQGGSPVNGPHQGAWVDTPTGEEHWFLHFQDRGVFGRVVHLQPMTWQADGWPVIGAAGEPVPTHRRPTAPVVPQREPARCDDFTTTSLGLQWHWQANPEPDWLALPGDGTLRLRVLPDDVGDLRLLPRVLGQPLPGRPSTWTTSLTLGPSAPGTRAGLVVLGTEYAWLGIEETPGGVHVICRRSVGRGQEHTFAQAALPVRGVQVRVDCDAEGTIGFAWRPLGAAAWREVDTRFQATAGRWIGADIGLFAAAPLGTPDARNHVTFGPVSVDLSGVEEVAA